MSIQSLEQKIASKELVIGVVGFGYIGTCIGAVIAARGYRVFGVDVRQAVVNSINSGKAVVNEPGLTPILKEAVAQKKLSASTSYDMLAECDVILLTVGTPLGEDLEPDTKDIIAATRSIAPFLKDGHIVIVKSTLPPTATESVIKPILDDSKKQYHLSFCPERLAEGQALAEFETIPVVVGGVDSESSALAASFWTNLLGLRTITVANAKTAEFVKLADNLWIDLNVALANEIAILAEKLGIDALEVISAANTLPKGAAGQHANILSPSVGVGGYCLTKDPWFVHHLGKQFGIELKTPVTSRSVNDAMPGYSFKMIQGALESTGRTLKSSKVAILGLAFKNNTGDCRYTPTKPVVEAFQKSGCELVVCDPLVEEEDISRITSAPRTQDPLSAIAGAHAVVFLTGHDVFKQIPISKIIELVAPGAVIFDGRNFFDTAAIGQMKAAGLVYKGVGR